MGERDPHKIPELKSPKTSSYALVDCILEKLTTFPVTTHFNIIHEELALLRSSLGKFVELRDENEEIQSLWNRLLEVTYKVESLIDHFMINGAVQDESSPPFDSIFQEMSNMKVDVLKIQVKEVVARRMPSQASPSPSNEVVVGFNKEKESILNRLDRGLNRLQIVAIVGMPGLGKTTLATKVFTHPSNSEHFSARAWCSISHVLDKKKVLLNLFKQIDPKKASAISEKEHDVANELRRSLKERRYLIYLDDIWSAEAWSDLKASFPDDAKGSRIIFTSRSSEAAPCDMLDQEPLILRELSEDESLELFQRKIFPEKRNGWPLELRDLGMQMVDKCKGLPLSIIVLAGVIATVDPGGWEKVLESVSFVSAEDSCRQTLELSYKYLPDYLKPCLLYFGVYPEDEEIQVRRLLRLWIAEGFIRKSETRSLEDVAEGYLKTLISRSLIMPAKQRWDGGFKTCRIHDLLRDFCMHKAKDEHFFHSVKEYGHDPCNLRRLCIYSEPEQLKEPELIRPRVRSLLFNPPQKFGGTSHMLHLYKLLTVLDLEQISFHRTFPDEIGDLVLLTFLAIRGNIVDMPTWLGNHPNLETFICIQESRNSDDLTLPISISKMKKLRYLCLRGGENTFRFCKEYPENATVLYDMDRLSGVDICSSSLESVLRMFPGLRRLKCQVWNFTKPKGTCDVFSFPAFLTKLESLTVVHCLPAYYKPRLEFRSLVNLKKLSLADFAMDSEKLSTISNQLPNLEILKLRGVQFDADEHTWEMKEGEFSKLRILHMSDTGISKWIACDEYEFESFEKLVLKGNWRLEELPCCLESTVTLEMIEVYGGCHESLLNMAKNIEQVQHSEWGNLVMKFIMH